MGVNVVACDIYGSERQVFVALSPGQARELAERLVVRAGEVEEAAWLVVLGGVGARVFAQERGCEPWEVW